MNIINCKKKLIKISICLIGIGILILGIGFGVQNIGTTKLGEYDTHKWYQTIRVIDGSWSYGFNISDDVSIFHIGEIK